ncbi:MAG: hypothetical protein LBG91_01975 [Treponema sp.]|jgi:hypothetical protein|nr:hypothetical protein [Treponema sp.]
MPLGKGQTNNRNGRPRKNQSLTEMLVKHGNKKIKIPPDDPRFSDPKFKELDGMKLRDALSTKLWQLAIFKDDLPAMKYIFDRIDGKPIQTLRAEIDRGDMEVITAVQKDLFEDEDLEGVQDEGTLEPPEEAGSGAGV